MASFSLYAPKLKQLEGGYVNNPNDKGGATNKGVTLALYRSYYGVHKTATDLKNISDTEWTHIMKSEFWDKMKADAIKNQSIAELCVDWLVNSGASKIKNIQKIIGTDADGIVGAKTLAAINNVDQQKLHFKIKCARAQYFEACVIARPVNICFYDGWINRLCNFKYKKI